MAYDEDDEAVEAPLLDRIEALLDNEEDYDFEEALGLLEDARDVLRTIQEAIG